MQLIDELYQALCATYPQYVVDVCWCPKVGSDIGTHQILMSRGMDTVFDLEVPETQPVDDVLRIINALFSQS